MTEAAFQAARKVMQSANYIRGLITKAKGEVAKWTAIEDAYRRELRYSQADGAKKCLEKAIVRLEELKARFAAVTFPDPNLKEVQKKKHQCSACGDLISIDREYCMQCANESD